MLRSIALAVWVALGPAALAGERGAAPRDPAAAGFEWSGARDSCPHGPLAAKAPTRPRLQPRADVPARGFAATAASLAPAVRPVLRSGPPVRCGRYTHLRLGVLLI